MSRQTLLKIEVPLRLNTRWYNVLQQAFMYAGIPVNWQSGGFHVTAIFMYNDMQKDKLKEILYNIKEFNNKIKQNENKKFKGQTPTPLCSTNLNG